jgi:LysM repeat protein
MKKLLILFVLVTVVFGLYSEENLLWCKKIIFNEPTKHVIQKGDFFSKLSKQYYGTVDYWRELALINRAPNKDLVFPGEEVVIPSLDAMKKLKTTRMLSVVNDIVKDQNDWIAKNGNITSNYAFEETKPEPKPDEQTATVQESVTTGQETATEVSAPGALTFDTEPLLQEEMEKSSMLPIILTVVAIALIVGLMALYLYRRKKKYEMEAFEPSEEKEEEITMVDEDEEMDDVYSDPFSATEAEREREGVLVS